MDVNRCVGPYTLFRSFSDELFKVRNSFGLFACGYTLLAHHFGRLCQLKLREMAPSGVKQSASKEDFVRALGLDMENKNHKEQFTQMWVSSH